MVFAGIISGVRVRVRVHTVGVRAISVLTKSLGPVKKIQKVRDCVCVCVCALTVAKGRGQDASNQHDRHWSRQSTAHACLHGVHY